MRRQNFQREYRAATQAEAIELFSEDRARWIAEGYRARILSKGRANYPLGLTAVIGVISIPLLCLPLLAFLALYKRPYVVRAWYT
jgi:hypothetical protein